METIHYFNNVWCDFVGKGMEYDKHIANLDK